MNTTNKKFIPNNELRSSLNPSTSQPRITLLIKTQNTEVSADDQQLKQVWQEFAFIFKH